MKNILITGGAGFFGELLKKELLSCGYNCVSIDLEKDNFIHPNFKAIKGDIRDISLLNKICEDTKFDVIFHCAAILAHAIKDKNFLWTSNVDGTENIAETAKKYNIGKVVFISSNCLWVKNSVRPVKEDDTPNPIEIYGKSKWEGEKVLKQYKEFFNYIIFRSPTIIDEGRLGLLTILFEFINEGRKVWVVGEGNNLYQFIYAKDLVNACKQAINYNKSAIFNVGSDNVESFRDVYNYVINKAQTGARVASLPRNLTIFLMKLAHKLKISPLGPYQYKMIASNFIFDTNKIKKELNWKPTLTNKEMLYKAYEYYHKNRQNIEKRTDVSAHKQAAKMGIIRLLKWIS